MDAISEKIVQIQVTQAFSNLYNMIQSYKEIFVSQEFKIKLINCYIL